MIVVSFILNVLVVVAVYAVTARITSSKRTRWATTTTIALILGANAALSLFPPLRETVFF